MVMSATRLKGRPTLAVDGFLEELEKEDLKKRTDLVALFESFGVKLAKRGSSFMGLCPWHDDKNPSLSVDKTKGVYHCFGCGESGDAIELVKKMKGLSFREAVSYLKGEHGVIFAVPSVIPERRMEEIAARGTSPFLLDTIAQHYEKSLVESPEARSYLEGRGLWNPEVMKRFCVGYSDGKLGEIVSEADRTELVRVGVLRRDGSEHFERCIVIPLFDEASNVVGFYGRRIEAGSSPAHLYLPGPHQGLANRMSAKVYRDSLVLTEAVLDALSLACVGVQNAIPCYGVNGFTEEHEKLLRDERVQEVVIAFDADEAGRKGAVGLKERLVTLGLKVLVIEPDTGKDWNDWAIAGGTAEAFVALIASSRSTSGGTTPEVMTSEKREALAMAREAGRVVFLREDVRYRVAGVRESFAASLRVSIRAQKLGEDAGRAYVDTVDLYSARSRASYAQASALAGLEAVRVEKDLLAMLDLLEAERDERLRATETGPQPMTEEERAAALELLRDSDVPQRIVDDLEKLGYVGEQVNKLLLYLAATSRKMADPISVIVSSQSASGKSYLIDTVKTLMPEEDVVSMTSLSDQALNYLGEDGLMHKFLVMGEAIHAPSVEHQIREMLSAKELSRLVAVKDDKTGELSSKLVRKKVLVSVAMSTTSSEVNPENASRFFVVSADESEEQTRGVHEAQRQKYSLERLAEKEDEIPAIIARHRAAQRLLKGVGIVNPYARYLSFPARMMRTRRDHERFLDLIAAACYLRQYQKEVQKDAKGREYIECDLEDYRIAHRIMSAILPSTLSSFPRSAKELYASFRACAKKRASEESLDPEEVTLTQRDLREATGLSQMFVKRNLRTLCEYEYLVEVGGFQRGSRRGYRLVQDEELALVDLSSIPSPEELARIAAAAGLELQNIQSGAEWVRSGSDPLLQG